MASLTNKRILLGVTGGIAAYKSAELIRQLQQLGATVKVIMTPGATEFITPLTLQALSGNPVHLELLDTEAEAGMGHIELARWADLILVAPASADFLTDLNSGKANSLLLAVCLATKAPLAVAPAMNQGMWNNTSTQNNIASLEQKKVIFFGPAKGVQACGDVGPGRMSEPEEIASLTANLFESTNLSGKTVVITAGPTREAIDPVRYISNHSSGKMGYALATAAVEAGAKVILISGPVSLQTPDRVKVINVISADQMHQSALQNAKNADVFIAAAAVADYRPKTFENQKIKKSTETLTIELVKNPDIVSDVAMLDEKPLTVGFAAETQQLEEYAKSKLIKKGLDAIIANDVSDTAIGFNSDDNAVLFITSKETEAFQKMSKDILARQLIQKISELLQQ